MIVTMLRTGLDALFAHSGAVKVVLAWTSVLIVKIKGKPSIEHVVSVLLSTCGAILHDKRKDVH